MSDYIDISRLWIGYGKSLQIEVFYPGVVADSSLYACRNPQHHIFGLRIAAGISAHPYRVGILAVTLKPLETMAQTLLLNCHDTGHRDIFHFLSESHMLDGHTLAAVYGKCQRGGLAWVYFNFIV